MKVLFLIIIAFLFAACTQQETPQQQVFLQELANRSVTCMAGADCEAKWNRAIEWVSKHSDAKIKTITQHLIQTDKVSSAGDFRPKLKYPEFTVVKYAKGHDSYVMEFSSYCDKGFVCNPSGLKLKAGFVTFVMGLPAGVSEVKPGVFEKTITQ